MMKYIINEVTFYVARIDLSILEFAFCFIIDLTEILSNYYTQLYLYTSFFVRKTSCSSGSIQFNTDVTSLNGREKEKLRLDGVVVGS